MSVVRLALLMMLFVSYGSNLWAQNKVYDEQAIHTVCKLNADQVEVINRKLYFLTLGKVDNIRIETLRETYALAMKETLERTQINTEKMPASQRSEWIRVITSTTSTAFKYGLCQRYRRPDAKVETLSSEFYFMCRKEAVEGVPMKAEPCF
jgi:hypothetical protein